MMSRTERITALICIMPLTRCREEQEGAVRKYTGTSPEVSADTVYDVKK